MYSTRTFFPLCNIFRSLAEETNLITVGCLFFCDAQVLTIEIVYYSKLIQIQFT